MCSRKISSDSICFVAWLNDKGVGWKMGIHKFKIEAMSKGKKMKDIIQADIIRLEETDSQ